MAKKSDSCESVGTDMNGQSLTTCDRVEISPHFDLWARGARFGQIRRKRRDGKIAVRMDNKRVRRLFYAMPGDLKKIR